MIQRRYSEILISNTEFIKRIKSHKDQDSTSSYIVEKNSSIVLQKLIPNNTPKLLRHIDEEKTLVFEYRKGMVDIRESLLVNNLEYSLKLFHQVLELLKKMEYVSMEQYNEYRSFDGFELRNLGIDKGKIFFFDPHNYSIASIEKDIARFMISYLMIRWPLPIINNCGLRGFVKTLKNTEYNNIVFCRYVREILTERKQHAKIGRNFIIRFYVTWVFFLYNRVLKNIENEF